MHKVGRPLNSKLGNLTTQPFTKERELVSSFRLPIPSEEWSASTSQSPLLVHQSGHVSQFFEEWQFEINVQDVSPRREFDWTPNLCDWGAIEKSRNTIVFISRVYNRLEDKLCDKTTNLLGIATQWEREEKKNNLQPGQLPPLIW